ncbi:hypothetical protein CY34DRAFT_811124 [Suillus luteus UH-Slu-Lm8-n1]|uniref:Uncharacterized protein n=1 Tax=Suillus luteus UH-Slu-Lm8-n1 TaxID=930992 RepID=A0A0D0AEY0_9AGAM|nr:hypothetical protein CY34DRAFT_811124 [Suillus luteus UH-Slu-Lm8-n1]
MASKGSCYWYRRTDGFTQQINRMMIVQSYIMVYTCKVHFEAVRRFSFRLGKLRHPLEY